MISWLFLTALTTWQVVEIWHHSELMARFRAIVETWPYDSRSLWEVLFPPTTAEIVSAEEDEGQELSRARNLSDWLRSFADGLLGCPFCLSVWVGGIVAWLYWVSWMPLEPCSCSSWSHCVLLRLKACLFVSLMGLAASRLANIANDLSWDISRTPGRSAKQPD